MHSKPYTFLDHHENDEEAQTTPTPAPEAPSGNTQDAADTAVPTDLAVFASPPAVEGTTAPEPAVPASGSSDSLGFVEKSKGKKRVQHVSSGTNASRLT